MRLHVIAPRDRDLRIDQPWFATAALTLGFAGIMRLVGLDVVEYARPGSESVAAEKVEIMGAFVDALPDLLGARVQPGDVICYTDGGGYALQRIFPRAHHVEILVSYDAPPTPGIWRVFSSRAMQAWTLGRYTPPQMYDEQNRGVVIPHWVSPDEFYPGDERPTGEIVFVGRLDAGKVGCLPWLMAERPGLPFMLAEKSQRSEVRRLMAGARLVICPAAYLEPFGLAAVEAGFCGAPVLVPDLGAYVETIDNLLLGRRVQGGRADWLAALDGAGPGGNREVRLLRRQVQVDRFSSAVAARRYACFFRGLA